MKSTWSYFKGRIRRKGSAVASTSSVAAPAPAVGEWDEESPATFTGGQIVCKNRRVTDGSLLTCLGSDASALANKTRLSRSRAWRYLESRWWLSGCQPTAASSSLSAGCSETSSLLPSLSGPPLADPSAEPLLQPRLRRSVSSCCCFDTEDADDFDGYCRPRRNSLSELDENVGSDLPVEVKEGPAAVANEALHCETPDLMSFDNLP